MKIAFVTASVSRKAGGLFESVRRLAQTLRDSHCNMAVLAMEDEYTASDRAQWAPLDLQTYPVRGPAQFGYAPRLGQALAAHADIELLNLHGIWMYPAVATSAWARRWSKPVVVHTHGMLDAWAVRHHRWRKLLAGWLYQNAQLRGASCLRALCAAEADAHRRYGLKNPVCVVPNGIDLPGTAPTGAPPWQDVLERGRRVLLYLGRIHPKKGLSNLLHAWAALERDRPLLTADWALAVAGWDQDGHAAELRALARQLGIERAVAFVGPQFDAGKAACYAQADAFVLPSLSEGMPMVVLEAWAYGLPVLMTPPCNIPEGFAAGAAVRVEPEPGDIARGLRELVEMSESQRQQMGRNGYNLVAERFTWPIIAAQMEAVYQWLLGGGRRPDHVRAA
jgi:poly(glycerol-phosphate) alpha-glucosyltransferase